MLQRGRAVQSMKITLSSRNTYSQRINAFSKFVKDNFPNAYEETSADIAQNLKLPLDEDIILSFFASLYNESEGEFRAAATIGGYRSAINHLYRERLVPIPPELKQSMDDFVRGYRRRIAQAKEEGDIPITEGKRPLTVQGYRMLCKKSVEVEMAFRSKICSHAHLFTVMQWNLMVRSASVGSLLYHHIGWEGDAMVVRLPRHKGDQEGNHAIPRHLYANALEPHLCPILALAVHVLCNPYHISGDQRIFCQEDIKRDYCAWLNKCLNNLTTEERALLGANPADLGTHSI